MDPVNEASTVERLSDTPTMKTVDAIFTEETDLMKAKAKCEELWKSGPTGPQASTAVPTPEQEAGDKKGRQPRRPRGLINHFPTLELEHSLDVPFNVGWTFMSRMVAFKWKQLVWLLRARAAVQRPGGPPGAGGWRRPHRWLATLLARELASIWGHLGSAAQSLRGPRGPLLMR